MPTFFANVPEFSSHQEQVEFRDKMWREARLRDGGDQLWIDYSFKDLRSDEEKADAPKCREPDCIDKRLYDRDHCPAHAAAYFIHRMSSAFAID